MSVKKIIMIGATTVGKTTLAKRLRDDRFSPSHLETNGLAAYDICYQNQVFELWDCPGRISVDDLPRKYFREVNGVILVVNRWSCPQKTLLLADKLRDKCGPNTYVITIYNQFERGLDSVFRSIDVHDIVSFKDDSQERLLEILENFIGM